MKEKHTLATKVHSYRRADDAESLRRAVADVFAEVAGADAGGQAAVPAFELLAPLSPEVVSAALAGLTQVRNDRSGRHGPGTRARRAGAGTGDGRRPAPAPSAPRPLHPAPARGVAAACRFPACRSGVLAMMVLASRAARRN